MQKKDCPINKRQWGWWGSGGEEENKEREKDKYIVLVMN